MAALLPLLQAAFRNTQCCGKLDLREPALYPHINDLRLGFNFRLLASSGFDPPCTVQYLSPHVTFGFEFGERLTGQLFTHEMTQAQISLAVVSNLGRRVTDLNDLFSCPEETFSNWPCLCEDGLQFREGLIYSSRVMC